MPAPDVIQIIESNWPAILGAILLACFGAYLAWRNGYKARRAAAAAKFRAAVLTALQGLYPVPVAWPKNELRIRDELKERFPGLQTAVAEFETYVPWYKRKAFAESWNRYRLGDDGREIDQQDYWQYVPLKGTSVINGVVTTTHDQTKTYKLQFKTNVDHLLSFASEA
ncbi:hypothetical protein HZU83_20515 [Sphaerotilus montanus]|uniref:Uncharacterized protein n=1 Tax=Sphaerotilus montanus TaxID=522889 RepID=A0A7Y9QZA7_9BURK|nr:hypothetical protein [Sphaerotilus montanus]NYG32573.1 hypothetical protein [Sphaerotilus montanus]NZD59068.1 hypothetical protein [Sphaerotilus montanus]